MGVVGGTRSLNELAERKPAVRLESRWVFSTRLLSLLSTSPPTIRTCLLTIRPHGICISDGRANRPRQDSPPGKPEPRTNKRPRSESIPYELCRQRTGWRSAVQQCCGPHANRSPETNSIVWGERGARPLYNVKSDAGLNPARSRKSVALG